MACYKVTTCGGVNPYYSFQSTDTDLTAHVGKSVRLSSITPDSGTGAGRAPGPHRRATRRRHPPSSDDGGVHCRGRPKLDATAHALPEIDPEFVR